MVLLEGTYNDHLIQLPDHSLAAQDKFYSRQC